MISIHNIEENFKTFTRHGGYHENEIFTKFEDAFLAEAGAVSTGFKIIHGYRSKIKRFPKMVGKWCELGDLLLLSYSPLRMEARLLLLQFKRSDRYKSGVIKVTIEPDQFTLYKDCPDVDGKNIPRDILSCENHIPKRGGAMFALLEEKPGGAALHIMNATKLDSRGKKVYRYNGTGALTNTCAGSFEFCEDIPSVGEFLRELKALRVGKDIAWGYAEKLLYEFVYSDRNQYPVVGRSILGIRAAMFLNVDDLV